VAGAVEREAAVGQRPRSCRVPLANSTPPDRPGRDPALHLS